MERHSIVLDIEAAYISEDVVEVRSYYQGDQVGETIQMTMEQLEAMKDALPTQYAVIMRLLTTE